MNNHSSATGSDSRSSASNRDTLSKTKERATRAKTKEEASSISSANRDTLSKTQEKARRQNNRAVENERPGAVSVGARESFKPEKSVFELEAQAVEDDENERVRAENEQLRQQLQNVAVAVVTTDEEGVEDKVEDLPPIHKRDWTWCLVVIILGAIGAAVALTVGKQDDPVLEVIESPTPEATLEPTTLVPSAASTTASPTSQRQAYLEEILAEFAPFEGHKAQAFDWIVNKDTWEPWSDTFSVDGAWKERFALAVFFYALDGPNWPVRYGFLGADHHCFWNGEYQSGVTCNFPEADQVEMLRFSSSSDLFGTLPSELTAMKGMRELNIFQNELGGTLPSWIGSLSQLTKLTLIENDLTGPIPSWLADMPELDDLDLYGNGFTGGLPTWLGSMTRLTRLNLSENTLTGTIPVELIDLTNLVNIDLHGNWLTGVIPPLPSSVSICFLAADFERRDTAADFESRDTNGEDNCFSDTSNVDAICEVDFNCGKCLAPTGLDIVDCESLIEDLTLP